jgi:hypothetical protein
LLEARAGQAGPARQLLARAEPTGPLIWGGEAVRARLQRLALDALGAPGAPGAPGASAAPPQGDGPLEALAWAALGGPPVVSALATRR